MWYNKSNSTVVIPQLMVPLACYVAVVGSLSIIRATVLPGYCSVYQVVFVYAVPTCLYCIYALLVVMYSDCIAVMPQPMVPRGYFTSLLKVVCMLYEGLVSSSTK